MVCEGNVSAGKVCGMCMESEWNVERKSVECQENVEGKVTRTILECAKTVSGM